MNTLNHSIVMNEDQYYGILGFMYLLWLAECDNKCPDDNWAAGDEI